MPDSDPESFRQRLWLCLAQVPKGRVVTYGQLAELAGQPRSARQVGRLLSQLPADTRLPWHRVVNAQGRISFPEGSPAYQRQRARLEAEGVRLQRGRLSLISYRWQPGNQAG